MKSCLSANAAIPELFDVYGPYQPKKVAIIACIEKLVLI